MNNFLINLALLNAIFSVWILLDSSAVRWFEGWWKKLVPEPPADRYFYVGYDAGLSKEYVKWLLICVYLSLLYVVIFTGRYELIPAFLLQQQCGKEDVGYWYVGTRFFKKNWNTVGDTGRWLGLSYPVKWPWLNWMPILRLVGNGQVLFRTLIVSWLGSEAIVALWLFWFNTLR